nr:hypothetical protein CFP56_10457 [Quercus suber]
MRSAKARENLRPALETDGMDCHYDMRKVRVRSFWDLVVGECPSLVRSEDEGGTDQGRDWSRRRGAAEVLVLGLLTRSGRRKEKGWNRKVHVPIFGHKTAGQTIRAIADPKMIFGDNLEGFAERERRIAWKNAGKRGEAHASTRSRGDFRGVFLQSRGAVSRLWIWQFG